MTRTKLIPKPEVLDRVGATYPTIWKGMRAGNFPRSREVGGKAMWLEAEIEDWIVSRPVRRLKGDSAAGAMSRKEKPAAGGTAGGAEIFNGARCPLDSNIGQQDQDQTAGIIDPGRSELDTALNGILTNDREFFAANPRRRYRLRPAHEMERWQGDYVCVRQLVCGVRQRVVVCIAPPQHPDQWSDKACAALYRRAAAKHPKILQIAAQLRRAFGRGSGAHAPQ